MWWAVSLISQIYFWNKLYTLQAVSLISQIYFWNKTLRVSDRGTVRRRFYSKNKFEKLVHLVGFIVRIQN